MLSALYTLALLLAFFASSIALGGPSGILTIILLGLFPLLLCLFKSNIPGLVYISLLVLIVLMLPAVSISREATRRTSCKNNLKQLGLALHNYQQHHKCFPPAVVYDDNGKPMHSWRVLILPFLEGYDTPYEQYDFNEPWDGPNNIKLLEQRPYCFACLSDELASSDYDTSTSYIAFVGPGTIWSDKDVNPANRRSVMLIETSGSDVKWTEPRDYVMPADNTSEQQTSQPAILRTHFSYPGFFYHPIPFAHIAFSDGSIEIVPTDSISNNTYPRGDRESIRTFNKRWIVEHSYIDRPFTIKFAVWLFIYILLIHWAVRCKNTAQSQTAEVAETNADAVEAKEE